MNDKDMLVKAIGVSVGTYPNDIADMLVRNKVIAPAPDYTTNQLVDGIVDGLNKNADFTLEFASWLDQIQTTLNL